MKTAVLKEFGLTDNEILIYLYLLRAGESTSGPIIKETKISNSRVYESLNSLIKKGFVSYNIQRNGKHFQATNPKIFLKKEEERKNALKRIIPELISITSIKEQDTKTKIYEGYEGFKISFRKIIEDCPKGKEIYILGFSEQEYKIESLRLFLSDMNLRSASKKHKLKIILNSSVKETIGKDREKEKITEVRYLPKKYISPGAIDIFEDYVYIFLWEEKPFVFMIKNKKIAESFKQYFNLLWKLGK